jgi:phage-related protein
MLDMLVNGVSMLSTYGVAVTRYATLLPPKRNNSVSIDGRDGVWDFGGNSYEQRPLKVTIGFEETSIAAVRAKIRVLAGIFSSAVSIAFSDEPNIAYQNCRIYSAPDLNDYELGMELDLKFDCDPYLLGPSVSGSVGSDQDYGSPFDIFPVVTVTMTSSATSLMVGLLSSGETVQIVDSLAADDELVFDMGKGKVTKNGANRMAYVALASRFFSVPKGIQRITVQSDGTFTTTMTYNKRYL